MKRILRLPAVSEKTGLSSSEIYRRIENETFPLPVQLGPKLVGWIEEEIDDWIAELPRGVKEQPRSLRSHRRKLDAAHAT